MSIQSILDSKSKDLLAISSAATVKDAADQMLMHGMTSLVVTNGDKVAGVVSEREIVHAVVRNGEPSFSMPVIKIAAAPNVAIAPDDSVKRAMNLMLQYRVSILPVIRDGKLVGALSARDVVMRRLDDLEMEADALREAYNAMAGD